VTTLGAPKETAQKAPDRPVADDHTAPLQLVPKLAEIGPTKRGKRMKIIAMWITGCRFGYAGLAVLPVDYIDETKEA
jgi:hypothetical protein